MEVLPYYSARLIEQHEWWRYWTLEEIVHFVLFQICFSAPVDLVIKGLEESTGVRKFWGAKHFCKEGKEKITIPMFFEKTGRPRYPIDHFLEKLPKEAVAKIKPEYKYKGIFRPTIQIPVEHDTNKEEKTEFVRTRKAKKEETFVRTRKKEKQPEFKRTKKKRVPESRRDLWSGFTF